MSGCFTYVSCEIRHEYELGTIDMVGVFTPCLYAWCLVQIRCARGIQACEVHTTAMIIAPPACLQYMYMYFLELPLLRMEQQNADKWCSTAPHSVRLFPAELMTLKVPVCVDACWCSHDDPFSRIGLARLHIA